MSMKNKIKIVYPGSKAVSDPLFILPDDKLGDYVDAHKADISERCFQVHPEFVFRKIADEGILVPTGKVAQSFNGIINLNPTSVFLWQLFASPSSANLIYAKVKEQYDETESLSSDILDFVVTFYRMGLLLPL
jgi:hypothetical protein